MAGWRSCVKEMLEVQKHSEIWYLLWLFVSWRWAATSEATGEDEKQQVKVRSNGWRWEATGEARWAAMGEDEQQQDDMLTCWHADCTVFSSILSIIWHVGMMQGKCNAAVTPVQPQVTTKQYNFAVQQCSVALQCSFAV
jgi:hypothetical protein